MKPLLLALLAIGGGGLLLGSKGAGASENESGAPPLPPLPPTGGGGSGSTSTPPFVPPPPGSSGSGSSGSGSSSSGSTTDPPDSVLAAVTAALATANPASMRATAAQLRKQGWTLQAAGLEEAARLTELAQQTGQTPPPVASPPASPPVVPGAGSVPLPPGVPPAKPPVLTVPPKVRLLRSGLSGADVAAWQTVLKADGYDLGATGVDGKFGPKTVAATKAWQLARNVKPDGIVGPATLAKIGTKANTPALPPAKPAINPSKWRTLKQGAAGTDVAEWQRVLIRDGYGVGSTGADGKFGPNTTKATKAWQSARGLNPDGIVGPNTRAKISSSTIMVAGDVQPLELMSSTPLPGIVPHMDPLPDVNPARALAARTCVMLFNARPGEEDRGLVEQFQALTGAKETGLYTSGTALKFVQFGLVPPKPFYWSKKGASRSKRQYRDILLALAAKDPARHDEWAAAALVR